jgi:hypothetical protein
MFKVLGKHKYKTDWNHIPNKIGVNAFIGKLADGSVATVQTMPWDYRPWGCASGANGSCNDHWIQFECCEDNLIDKEYFNAVYKEACELTAYLCLLYNIDPMGKVEYNGLQVPTILCHRDAHKLKLASDHGDIIYWIKKHNKTMDDIREDVAGIIEEYKDSLKQAEEDEAEKKEAVKFQVGDLVSLDKNAVYWNGKPIPQDIKQQGWRIMSISGNRVVIDESEDGYRHICSAVHKKYLTLKFKKYKVQITTSALNARKGPSTDYKINYTLKKNDVETIIQEKNNWGKLESGKGWIGLKYTKKI